VRDNQGNVTRVARTFSVGVSAPTPGGATSTPGGATPTSFGPTPTGTAAGATPSPGGTPAPTPSVGPTPIPTTTVAAHDSLVAPLRRLIKVRLARGVESVARTIRIAVRNMDVSPVPEQPGHEIQLVGDDDTCPPGTLAGAPDLLARVAGTQDRLLVAGGRRKTAAVPLVIHRDAFTSTATAPATCTLRFVAVGPGGDPTPGDNATAVELQVIDGNDR
ncbi:MAG: hypothetical protein ACREQL_10090, partial [Candidatus Binatia bacterium]